MILNENDVYGAGGGNRTRFISLEDLRSKFYFTYEIN